MNDPESIRHAADWPARRWEADQPPETWMIAAIAALILAALCWAPAWRLLRHGTTVVHEMGHVLVGFAAGRRIRGIRLHSDASGLTVSTGRPRRPGMLMTCLASCPAPALLGLELIAAATAGYSGAALTASIAPLAVSPLLALSTTRANLELLRVRGQGSDAELAAEHSILPAMVWILLFNAVTLAAAGLAVPPALLD